MNGKGGGHELAQERFREPSQGRCSYCMEKYSVRGGRPSCGCEFLSEEFLEEDYALMTHDYTEWQKARRRRIRALRSQEAHGL